MPPADTEQHLAIEEAFRRTWGIVPTVWIKGGSLSALARSLPDGGSKACRP
jgi:hypothetical protein